MLNQLGNNNKITRKRWILSKNHIDGADRSYRLDMFANFQCRDASGLGGDLDYAHAHKQKSNIMWD